MPDTKKHRIVGIGEVLWDVFPDESRFGGAPANFVCHAAALGAIGSMVSSVGCDPLGDRVFKEFDARGIDTNHIARDRQHGTGKVDVTVDDNGQASYQFASNCAWDHLPWDVSLQSLASECDAVCFGSLGQRSSLSKQTIHRFLDATRPACLRVFDVNLRQEFYSSDVIEDSLRVASVLKLNEDELPVMADLLNAPTDSDHQVMRWFGQQFDLRCVALTRGAAGSFLYADGSFDVQKPPKITVVDTVGAGDAFTAALVVGLLAARPISEIHRAASELASLTCTRPGAVPVAY
jgi:fructokinase